MKKLLQKIQYSFMSIEDRKRFWKRLGYIAAMPSVIQFPELENGKPLTDDDFKEFYKDYFK